MASIPLLQTAIRTLKTIVPNTSGDLISLDEIFTAQNFNLAEKQKNKRWLGIKLAYIKPYNFVATKLGIENGKNALTHIELTNQGKIALGRMEGKLDEIPRNGTEVKNQNINPDEKINFITNLTTKLSQTNPDKDIIIDYNGGTISVTNRR